MPVISWFDNKARSSNVQGPSNKSSLLGQSPLLGANTPSIKADYFGRSAFRPAGGRTESNNALRFDQRGSLFRYHATALSHRWNAAPCDAEQPQPNQGLCFKRETQRIHR
jgi:hypothetical protein